MGRSILLWLCASVPVSGWTNGAAPRLMRATPARAPARSADTLLPAAVGRAPQTGAGIGTAVPQSAASGVRGGVESSFPVSCRYTTSSLWLHSIRTLPTSSVLRGIRAPVLASVIWSALLAVLHAATRFEVPCSRPHTLLSWALALLLVHRTNSSHDRFWEGRKIWEKLLNRCRDLIRTSTVYRDAIGLRRLRRIACLITILPRVLRAHLQVRARPGLSTHVH